jgi:hypothetical protein
MARSARTFVRVELVEANGDGTSPFADAMTELGFRRTIKGSKTRVTLRLPSGMYFIEKTEPVAALDLTRQAARKANVEARIFCVPAGGDVRFGHLQRDDVSS